MGDSATIFGALRRSPGSAALYWLVVKLFRQARPFAVFLFITLAFQWGSGVYAKLLDGNYDEASHFLTSLMVRDYLVSGALTAPMRFAENYYLHYPKIAIGHWPPLFYLLNGAWLLITPATSASAFFLLALTAAGFAARLFARLRRDAPPWAAWMLAVLFLTLQPVFASTIEFMSELVLSWLVLEACWAFERWLEDPRPAPVLWFSLWSALALLTKATGGGLAFLPPMAILLTRRWTLLRRPSLVVAGLLVAAAAGPWYLLAPGARHEASGHKFAGLLGVNLPSRVAVDSANANHVPVTLTELVYRTRRSLLAAPILFSWLGPLLLLALLGLWLGVRTGQAPACAAAGLLLSFLIFRFVLVSAAWEPRMMLPMLAPLLCFIWTGARVFPLKAAPAVLAALIVCTAGYNLAAAPRRAGDLPGPAARWLATPARAQYRVILLCGDGAMEGAMTALIAEHDPRRPSRYAVRASKLLAVTAWGADYYKPRATTEAAVLQQLDQVPVELVVFQSHVRNLRFHEALLRQTIQHNPGRFTRVEPADPSLEVYKMDGQPPLPPGAIPRVDMFLFGLGRSLSTE